MKFELTKYYIQDISEKLERKDFKILKAELSELHHADRRARRRGR
jgi:hypothetical protein